jgi:hypothetical protein
MALTEIQLPTKTDFYAKVANGASKMNAIMFEWEELAEFIEKMGTADLDAIGVPSGAIRTDLLEFRTVLNEMVGFFKGTSTTQTEVPETVVDKIRSM